MTIEFNCKDCQSVLRVADEHLGKKARCPSCGSIQDVVGDTDGAQPLAETTYNTGSSRWLMRTPDGNEYGPVEKSELDSWMRDGRISAQCSLRTESDPQWKPASLVYPTLASAATSNPQVSSSGNPFAAPMQNAQRTTYQQSAYSRQSNGVTILVLGILSIFCCGIILGPIAWSMGSSELSAIKRGQVDPSAHGITMAGFVLGIIGTCLHVLYFAFNCMIFATGAGGF